LLAGVVGGDQEGLTGRGAVYEIVAEDEGGTTGDDALGLEDVEVDVEGDLTEGDDDFEVGEEFKLALEVRTAVAEFLGSGFVAGRGAVGGGGDVKVVELEAVFAGDGDGLGGEASLVKDAVEDIAGAVAREHAAGAVGAVGSGGQAEDKDAGVGIAEGGNGASPVGLVAVGAALEFRNFRSVRAEAGAAATVYDFLLEYF